MKNIRLKLKAISPIHTGSGEVFEPTNFIIDNQVLYHFRDEDFLESLNKEKTQQFLNIVNEMKEDSFVKIHKFIKDNKELAKQIAFLKIMTTKGIQKEYDSILGNIVNFEGKGKNIKKVFNQFEIQRVQRKQLKSKNGFAYVGYIPGSSLKGSISTAYREFIYQKYGEKKVEELFENPRNMKNLLFRFFKVSDSRVIKPKSMIGFAVNKERFEDNNLGPFTFIEVLHKDSEYIVDISYDEKKINFDDIIKACNNHYEPIFDEMLDSENENISEYFSDEVYEYYSNLKLKQNQFLLRVGKHSGARAVTIDGLRNISVRENKRKFLRNQTEETTTWLFGSSKTSNTNLLPFGWIIAEII